MEGKLALIKILMPLCSFFEPVTERCGMDFWELHICVFFQNLTYLFFKPKYPFVKLLFKFCNSSAWVYTIFSNSARYVQFILYILEKRLE